MNLLEIVKRISVDEIIRRIVVDEIIRILLEFSQFIVVNYVVSYQ